jgi:hypothetical protein
LARPSPVFGPLVIIRPPSAWWPTAASRRLTGGDATRSHHTASEQRAGQSTGFRTADALERDPRAGVVDADVVLAAQLVEQFEDRGRVGVRSTAGEAFQHSRSETAAGRCSSA